MRARVVADEYLDHLAPNDPAARRSRRDLIRINALMGNFRWLCRVLEERAPGASVIEVGAGDGRLATSLADAGHAVTAVDLAPKPASCGAGVRWVRGDVGEVLGHLDGEVLLASLFWHHFEASRLERFAQGLQGFRGILATEPLRRAHVPWLGVPLVPWVNWVTRHDLFVSIMAGFQGNELSTAFGLSGGDWEIEETGTCLGAYRLQAWRRE